MRFELFVALRYLLAPRRQARVSLVSLFSTIGVAVGVMALIIALALMTGLQGELRAKLLGAIAHIYVYEGRRVRRLPAPRWRRCARSRASSARRRPILGKALVSTNRAEAFITIKGIDPALEVDVTDIRARCGGAASRI